MQKKKHARNKRETKEKQGGNSSLEGASSLHGSLDDDLPAVSIGDTAAVLPVTQQQLSKAAHGNACQDLVGGLIWVGARSSSR
jgi:hypothetical protein